MSIGGCLPRGMDMEGRSNRYGGSNRYGAICSNRFLEKMMNPFHDKYEPYLHKKNGYKFLSKYGLAYNPTYAGYDFEREVLQNGSAGLTQYKAANMELKKTKN